LDLKLLYSVKPTTKASTHKIIEIIDRKSGRKEMVVYTMSYYVGSVSPNESRI
jgi:hypothetical protein